MLILTALFEHPDLVVDLAGHDFRGVVGGSPEGSLLHHAAWSGTPASWGGCSSAAPTRAPTAARVRRSDGPPTAPGTGRSAAATTSPSPSSSPPAGNRIEAGLLEEADGPPYEWLAERLRTGA